MKRLAIIFIMVIIGLILFLMALIPSFNNNIIAFTRSIPLIGIFVDETIKIVIDTWWNAIPFKPLIIFLLTIVGLYAYLRLTKVIRHFRVLRFKKVAAQKTMTHMAIHLDDKGNLIRNDKKVNVND